MKRNARLTAGHDHLVALRPAWRHRLFDQNALARAGGADGLRGVKVRRRRDINGVHIGVGEQVRFAIVRPRGPVTPGEILGFRPVAAHHGMEARAFRAI